MNYIDYLVNSIHSTIIATIDSNNHPITRVIDMMLYDEEGIYFLTAKGKEFYKQLMDQKYIALSATKDKVSISLNGYVKNIGKEKLNNIFEKNTYMQNIYPEGKRAPLEVFQIYQATGQYFDISNPSHIFRDSFAIGTAEEKIPFYIIQNNCTGCNLCDSVCPQQCINTHSTPISIDFHHCLHCGSCVNICPEKAIMKRG